MKLKNKITNKEELVDYLKSVGVQYTKLIFKQESPYMKARYRAENVTWEAWLYKPHYSTGLLITGDDDYQLTTDNLKYERD